MFAQPYWSFFITSPCLFRAQVWRYGHPLFHQQFFSKNETSSKLIKILHDVRAIILVIFHNWHMSVQSLGTAVRPPPFSSEKVRPLRIGWKFDTMLAQSYWSFSITTIFLFNARVRRYGDRCRKCATSSIFPYSTSNWSRGCTEHFL